MFVRGKLWAFRAIHPSSPQLTLHCPLAVSPWARTRRTPQTASRCGTGLVAAGEANLTGSFPFPITAGVATLTHSALMCFASHVLLHHVLTQGTPGYAAPEVLSRGRLSLAADVWSFGVLLLELCHGMRFKHILARQQAAFGGVAGAGVAGGGEERPGDDAGTADGGSTTGSAPAWAVLPATCPPQLAALVRACLSLNPLVRPSFDQVREH